jgi:hypothetical protein
MKIKFLFKSTKYLYIIECTPDNATINTYILHSITNVDWTSEMKTHTNSSSFCLNTYKHIRKEWGRASTAETIRLQTILQNILTWKLQNM